MGRLRRLGLLLGVVAGAGAVVRMATRHGAGRTVPGGILIGNARVYDVLTGLLLRSLFGGIAADAAAVASPTTRVLELGCGPGHLSYRLARDHGLDVTGLDLDPAMIERARANADGSNRETEPGPAFVVGDVASLPFADGSFDLVVSTFSVHHWADPAPGLSEIARVLRPGGRAIIWDFRPGSHAHPFGPRHANLPDPIALSDGLALHPLSVRPWRWPWHFEVAQRIELVRA